jgi:hypothetical protein
MAPSKVPADTGSLKQYLVAQELAHKKNLD